MSAYLKLIGPLVNATDLTRDQAADLMTEIMDGRLQASQIAAALAAMAAKGETADELAGFASVLRRFAVPVQTPHPVLDTCGTGGSGLSTPNTSTVAAFALAAGGVHIAKHGNRSSTGRCGSADVLEKLGVNIDLDANTIVRLIDQHNIGFMLAPKFHPAMRHAGPVRKAIGIRTTFNFLGPLANPAGARRQVLGVSDVRRAPLMAEALRRLGTDDALVVHGSDGLDEITVTGPTHAWRVKGDQVESMTITPGDAGLSVAAPDEILGGDAEKNVAVFEDLLDGRQTGAIFDLVLINAAAGFWVAGACSTLSEGVQKARALFSGGKVRQTFDAYQKATHEDIS